MKDSTYHSLLRISALTLAVVLLFVSGLLSPVTKQIAQNTQQYLASAIGMHASVVPTDLNQYTAELSQRDRILTQREGEIAAREIAVNLEEKGITADYSTYLLSVLLFLILVLIVLNYVLDYVRARERILQNTNEKMA
jgi:hypothetical protein